MPTVTVYFGGICTFFMSDRHDELDGFCRVVLVNAADGRTVAGHDIPPHEAVVRIGDGQPVTMRGLHMRLLSSNAQSLLRTAFTGSCPDLTHLVFEQGAELSRPSHPVVFTGDPAEAALFFDFKGGTLAAGRNDHGAVITTLVLQSDDVALETVPFVGGGPLEFPSQMVFLEDTTILVSNDDAIETTSKYDFYLHYLTAELVPPNPPIPPDPPSPIAWLRNRLPVIPHLPHWFGSIGAGCSNSTYP